MEPHLRLRPLCRGIPLRFSLTLLRLYHLGLIVYDGAGHRRCPCTMDDVRCTLLKISALRAGYRSGSEFLEQGELLVGKHSELRHARFDALLNRQWFMTFPAYFLCMKEVSQREAQTSPSPRAMRRIPQSSTVNRTSSMGAAGCHRPRPRKFLFTSAPQKRA